MFATKQQKYGRDATSILILQATEKLCTASKVWKLHNEAPAIVRS